MTKILKDEIVYSLKDYNPKDLMSLLKTIPSSKNNVIVTDLYPTKDSFSDIKSEWIIFVDNIIDTSLVKEKDFHSCDNLQKFLDSTEGINYLIHTNYTGVSYLIQNINRRNYTSWYLSEILKPKKLKMDIDIDKYLKLGILSKTDDEYKGICSVSIETLEGIDNERLLEEFTLVKKYSNSVFLTLKDNELLMNLNSKTFLSGWKNSVIFEYDNDVEFNILKFADILNIDPTATSLLTKDKLN